MIYNISMYFSQIAFYGTIAVGLLVEVHAFVSKLVVYRVVGLSAVFSIHL